MVCPLPYVSLAVTKNCARRVSIYICPHRLFIQCCTECQIPAYYNTGITPVTQRRRNPFPYPLDGWRLRQPEARSSVDAAVTPVPFFVFRATCAPRVLVQPQWLHSNRQLGVPPRPETHPVDPRGDIRPDDGDAAREARDRPQKVPKQHHDAVQLDQEPNQRPPKQNQPQTREEGRRALELLLPREEERRFLRADDYRQTD